MSAFSFAVSGRRLGLDDPLPHPEVLLDGNGELARGPHLGGPRFRGAGDPLFAFERSWHRPARMGPSEPPRGP